MGDALGSHFEPGRGVHSNALVEAGEEVVAALPILLVYVLPPISLLWCSAGGRLCWLGVSATAQRLSRFLRVVYKRRLRHHQHARACHANFANQLRRAPAQRRALWPMKPL